MSWADLFERARAHETDTEAVRQALEDRRDGDPASDGNGDDTAADATAETVETTVPDDPRPARVVADADVLAADLLVGGPAREALDHLRGHSWTALVASDPLLADAAAVVERLATPALAVDWRSRVVDLRVPVAHPPGDHPALASALHGGAMHVLTFEERLQSAGANAAVRAHVETSIKSPDAFARLFDPESLYGAVEDGDYPGPDRDPRA
jgi:hypothetical protein